MRTESFTWNNCKYFALYESEDNIIYQDTSATVLGYARACIMTSVIDIHGWNSRDSIFKTNSIDFEEFEDLTLEEKHQRAIKEILDLHAEHAA